MHPGPPGTGKTSVIAEIALQMTKQGKRVLISSQTNLAVDNALERLVEVPNMFPVRLGRLEALKLNPELHIDSASKRYKEMLLQKSREAEGGMLAQLEDGAQLASELELKQWIQEWRALTKLQGETQRCKDSLDSKEIEDRNAKATKLAAETEMINACTQAKLPQADVPRYLAVIEVLRTKGVDLAALSKEQLSIRKVLEKKQASKMLISQAGELATLNVSVSVTEQEIAKHGSYLGKTATRRSALQTATRFNNDLKAKRANAGFWSNLWSEITESPKDLAQLERELADATRLENAAESALPSLRLRLRTERQQAQILTASWEYGYLGIFGQSCTGPITSESKRIESLLEFAAILDAVQGTSFLVSLAGRRQIADADSGLRKAETRADEATANFLNAAKLLAEKVQDLQSRPDRASDIKMVISAFGLPEQSLSEDVFATLQQRLQAHHAMLRSIPPIQEALRIYRERLTQPAVDLQRAVIAEADVVGATCSGIAGAKDFEEDFDCVIVDEAGRTTPLELVMAIVRGKSVVLVGDHKQLPPFVSDALRAEVSEPDREYLESSIFETIYNTSEEFGRTAALHKQYRMSPPICEIVTSISYKDTPLETAGEALERSLGNPSLRAVHWIRPLGLRNRATIKGTGIVNEAEIEAAVEVLQRLMLMPKSEQHRVGLYSVGIISVYKQQAYAIERKIAELVRTDAFQIEVGTVDSFQGREMDAVILTFSETNPRLRRFFYDRRRLNVALSRAKEHLVIIGSLDQLGGQSMAFGAPNPLYELRLLIERAVAQGQASKESLNA